jgi:hypothetical protein
MVFNQITYDIFKFIIYSIFVTNVKDEFLVKNHTKIFKEMHFIKIYS